MTRQDLIFWIAECPGFELLIEAPTREEAISLAKQDPVFEKLKGARTIRRARKQDGANWQTIIKERYGRDYRDFDYSVPS